MKKILFGLLLGILSIGCSDDLEKRNVEIISFDELEDMLSKNENYSKYVATKANNMIVLATLSQDQIVQMEYLENNFYQQAEFQPLEKFYNTIGYDLDELSQFQEVYRDLAGLNVRVSDLIAISNASSISYLEKKLAAGVISMELSCSIHCEEVTAQQYASSFEGVQTGSTDYYIIMAQRGEYFRGCYHECLRYQD